jgi:hypothetical protein
MKGNPAEFSGLPSDWVHEVAGWNEGSVFSLHWLVR